MTNYNDGLWHGWNGGECPVHPETVVEVALNNHAPCVETAYQWFWEEGKSRIIAFRVIKEHKEPREFWIAGPYGMMGVFKTREAALCAYASDEIIHVREVTE